MRSSSTAHKRHYSVRFVCGIAAHFHRTCQVSRNFRESPEMEHDLQVSRKCHKISRNLRNLIDLIFFCKKHAFGVNARRFWCESEKWWSQGPEICAWRRQNNDCVVMTFAYTVYLVVRKMAPLVELAPFSGATMWWWGLIKTQEFSHAQLGSSASIDRGAYIFFIIFAHGDFL